MDNGSDAAAGTSEGAAWATIDKAASDVTAGNTIAIAPGTYRETIVADNAGTAGNQIKFVGDPECLYFDNENPGRVRITDTNAAEEPQNSAEGITSKRDYVEWHNLWIDGAIETIDFGTSYAASRIAYDCVLTAKAYGIVDGSAVRCTVVAGNFGFRNVVCHQCVSMAGSRGFERARAYNCLAIGAARGFSGITATYCDNCIALGGTTGFYFYPDAGSLVSCRSINCTGAAGNITAGAAVNCYWSMCNAVGDADFGTEGVVQLLDLRALLDLLPWVATNVATGLLRQGSNVRAGYGATDTDIGGHRLRLKG